MNNFQNIPETGFSSNDEKTSVIKGYIKQRQSGYLTLSMFSVIQLIAGARESVKGKSIVNSNIVEVMSKLFELGISNSAIPTEFTRDEVKILKQFIEGRMSHCEQERDSRATKNIGPDSQLINDVIIEKFNPDTYIGQKMLLIELREWLLGEEVTFSEYNDTKTNYAIKA
jgi:hypothetical protein